MPESVGVLLSIFTEFGNTFDGAKPAQYQVSDTSGGETAAANALKAPTALHSNFRESPSKTT